MATVQSSTNKVSDDLMASMNPTKATKSTTQEAQDRFMTLLVTQMRNQDPLNPLDNAQVTSQLAQLSTVTGIEKLNTSIESLMSNYKTSQSMQAVDMIGRSVLAPGSAITLKDGQALLGVDLAGAADKVTVEIADKSGAVVRTIKFTDQKEGVLPLAWDGKTDKGEAVADGQYSFKVTATMEKEKVEATSLSFGTVNSVTTGAQGVKLSIPNVGDVNVADVREII